jgi:TM2 domain-containing membrane protein YozV
MKEKNPIIAGFLNVLIVGLGHIYLGNWIRGIATFVVVPLAFGILLTLAGQITRDATCVSIFALILAGAVFADAHQAATKYNAKLPRKKCPYCAEVIQEEARVCKNCGRELEATQVAESTESIPVPQSQPQPVPQIDAEKEGQKARAREEAQRWWKSSQGEGWRVRGGAKCDADGTHIIQDGQGCLCKPKTLGDFSPDLVCERCFDEFDYEAWDRSCESAAQAELTLIAQDVAFDFLRKAGINK